MLRVHHTLTRSLHLLFFTSRLLTGTLLCLCRGRRGLAAAGSSKTRQDISRSSPDALQPQLLPPLTKLRARVPAKAGLVPACQELHQQNKPSASIQEGCPPFNMGSLGKERPSRSKGSHWASMQVNSRRALGKEAWICSMLRLKRVWEGAAVPPVILSELPAGLIEAKTLELGLKLHHFGS